jgi:hypothetical protein
MSRISAASDASRWPATVCAWVDREQRRRKKRAAQEQEPQPSEPFARSTKRVPHTELKRSRYFTRFLFDLDAIARRGSVRSAWQIATMYREAHRRGADRDPAVAKFLRRIRRYMESARGRYASDPRRSIRVVSEGET